jgi:hypothetical protein
MVMIWRSDWLDDLTLEEKIVTLAVAGSELGDIVYLLRIGGDEVEDVLVEHGLMRPTRPTRKEREARREFDEAMAQADFDRWWDDQVLNVTHLSEISETVPPNPFLDVSAGRG